MDGDVQELHGERATMDGVVALRARRALDAGCDGVIASGDSVEKLRAELGSEALIVTPGIRPPGAPADDQRRLLTPFQAARDGADYLVVGRPIRDAADPRAVAQGMIEEIRAGMVERERSTSRPPRGGQRPVDPSPWARRLNGSLADAEAREYLRQQVIAALW